MIIISLAFILHLVSWIKLKGNKMKKLFLLLILTASSFSVLAEDTDSTGFGDYSDISCRLTRISMIIKAYDLNVEADLQEINKKEHNMKKAIVLKF